MIERREFVGVAALALVGACTTGKIGRRQVADAYGIVGQMKTAPGKRGFVIEALMAG